MEGGFETKDERGTMMPLNDEETLKIEAEYSIDPEEKAQMTLDRMQKGFSKIKMTTSQILFDPFL